tara:strand:- start:53 stop:268 length:216 start_codon:yes stop_codon:yes gene_type:complete
MIDTEYSETLNDVNLLHAINTVNLSFNEISTLWLLSVGCNNTQIAERLHLSKMAVTKIIRRCQDKIKTELV